MITICISHVAGTEDIKARCLMVMFDEKSNFIYQCYNV